jgi:Na+/H+-translocating membrane pyrophosphatase
MARIASYVRKGAMAYIKQQYKVVSMIFACLVVPEQRAFLETARPAGTMIVAQD